MPLFQHPVSKVFISKNVEKELADDSSSDVMQ
jgi:hypothetical protein